MSSNYKVQIKQVKDEDKNAKYHQNNVIFEFLDENFSW